MVDASIYTVGGTVQVNKSGVYIPRQADTDLLKLCQESTFAYVLTPRQMGKSSLMIRTAERLIEEETQAVIIDLTQIGTQVSPNEWFSDFLDLLASQLMLSTDVKTWWQANSQSSLSRRFTRFFQEVVLAEISDPVVVFVDEIDTTLSLDFTDDFYAAIRYLYEARATDDELSQLTFVLIGVATPADLIRDPKRTPFNIGQRVELADFTQNEIEPLAKGLGLSPQLSQQVLHWVWQWTKGHPYLTQRLCRALVDHSPNIWTEDDIDRMVSTTFLGPVSEQDNNLQFVGDMLTKRAPMNLEREVLKVYQQIHRDTIPILHEEQSLVKSHLRLSGVVRRDGKHLTVRNPIYYEVFNRQWIQESQPENFWQRYGPVLKIAIPVTVASVLVAGMMTGLYRDSRRQRARAESNANLAAERLIEANAAKEEAEAALRRETDALAAEAQQRELAEEKQQEAETAQQAEAQQRKQTEVALKRAEEGEAKANRQATIVRTQTKLAEDNAAAAMEATIEAEDQKSKAEITAINASIRADSLMVEKLMASNLHFNALLAGLALGRRIKAEEAKPVSSKVLELLDCQTFVEPSVVCPGIKLQAAAALQKIYNFSGYLHRNTLKDRRSFIKSLSFSPDGRTLASCCSNGNIVKLRDKSGRELATLEDHTSIVWSVSFSPDGETLASGSDDGTVKLWDKNGRELQTLEGHTDAVTSVSFSPDGETLASGSDDGTVKLWDKNGRELQTLEGHTDIVTSVSFSPDGETLASGSIDETVKLWDKSGRKLQTLTGHTSSVLSVSFSSDGETLASSSADWTVKLWNKSGRELQTLEGHTSIVESVSFSPDGQTLASGSIDGTVKLWDKSGRELQTLEGHKFVESVSFSPDGQTLASGSFEGIFGMVKLWDKSGRELQTLESRTPVVVSVSFSPDGQTLASGSIDGTVKLWDKSGRELQTLEGHSRDVLSVSFSPDGQTLASGSIDETVKLWDRNGQELQTLKGHTDAVLSVSFSPDGQTLASSSSDKTIRLWDKRGRELQTLKGHKSIVWSVSFSPDGETLASSSDDGTVKLWDKRGRELQTLKGHTDAVLSVSFSPDGQTLASSSADRTVKLWDKSGRELQTLEGHTSAVESVSFSPDGETLASGSYDGIVKLWDKSGQELQALEGHTSVVRSMSFSPDGQTLVTSSTDATVKLWNFDLDDLIVKSCEWLRDYMTNPATPSKEKALCQDKLSQATSTSVPQGENWMARVHSLWQYLTDKKA